MLCNWVFLGKLSAVCHINWIKLINNKINEYMYVCVVGLGVYFVIHMMMLIKAVLCQFCGDSDANGTHPLIVITKKFCRFNIILKWPRASIRRLLCKGVSLTKVGSPPVKFNQIYYRFVCLCFESIVVLDLFVLVFEQRELL